MNKTEDEVVRLTAECLTRYWKRDYTFIFSHCAPKIVWISARQDEYLLTRDEVREFRNKLCGYSVMSSSARRISGCSQLFRTLRYNRQISCNNRS